MDARPPQGRRSRPTHAHFGFRLTPGPIVAVLQRFPRREGRAQAGDRIVAVEGSKDFDPMHLPDELSPRPGKPMKLTIERSRRQARRAIEMTVTPDASPPDPARLIPTRPNRWMSPAWGWRSWSSPRSRRSPRARPPPRPASSRGLAPFADLHADAKLGDEKNGPQAGHDRTRRQGLRAGRRPSTLGQSIPWKSIELTVTGSNKPDRDRS